MSSPAWMPLDIDAYLSDTLHLSAAEHGAYMLLIMRYWKDGGLPADERMIARFARLSTEQWADSRDVLAAFFEPGWKHKRIDAELAKAAEIIGKRKSAAMQKHSKSSAHAEQVQSKSTDTRVPPEPITSPPHIRSEEKRAQRAARLPENWALPEDWRQDAEASGLSADRVDAEAAKMLDWSRSSQAGAKLDWRAAWRNWCRKAAADVPRGRPPPIRAPSQSDVFKLIGERAANGSDTADRGSVRPAIQHLRSA